MAANKTLTNADRELGWLKGSAYPVTVANTYVGLMNTVGSLASGGTEVSGGSYARQPIASGGWSAIATGTDPNGNDARYITNSADITFPVPTADWGYVPGWELFDALAAGNRLYFGPLDPAQYVVINGVVKILAGTLKVAVA